MTIEQSYVERILADHDQWVMSMRSIWSRIRDSMSDSFWSPRNQNNTKNVVQGVTSNKAPQFEINRVRPWADSYEATLFYSKTQVEVQPDDVVNDGDDPNVIPDAEPITQLLNRWLDDPNFRATMRVAVRCGLYYAHGALRVVCDDRLRPIDALKLEYAYPWECVWDRRARKANGSRYLGHSRHITIDEAKRWYGFTPTTPTAIPDVLYGDQMNGPQLTSAGESVMGTDGRSADCSYVRVLELWFHEEDQFKVYEVVHNTPNSGTLNLVYESAISATKPNGLPSVPFIPLVLTALPEKPMFGISEGRSIYALAERMNFFNAWLAQGAEKSAARKLLYRAERLDEESEARIDSGSDQERVKIEGEGPLEDAAHWLTPPPMPTELVSMAQHLEQQFDRVSSTSGQGQAERYVAAAGVKAAGDYVESKMGTMREVLDRAVEEVCKAYLAELAVVLEGRAKDHAKREEADALTLQHRNGQFDAEPVTIDHKDVLSGMRVRFRNSDRQLVEIGHADLMREWRISIANGSATPAKAEKQRAELVQASPQLTALIAVSENPSAPPIVRQNARDLYDLYVRRFDLPSSLAYAVLAARAPAPLPAPPPPDAQDQPPVDESPVPQDPIAAGQLGAAGAVGLPAGDGGPGRPPGQEPGQDLAQGDEQAAMMLQ